MENQMKKFANKQFDKSLDPFLRGLKNHFGLTTKGSFVFLAGYGLKCPESYKEHLYDRFNFDGAEWRDDTDTDYDTAVDILIDRYSITKGRAFKDIRTNKELLEETIDDLMKIANSVATGWLSGPLLSYKKGIADDEKGDFITLVVSFMNELNQPADQF